MDYLSDDLNLDVQEEGINNNNDGRGSIPLNVLEELVDFVRTLDFNFNEDIDMKTPLIDIPMDQLGIICTLLPTNNNVRLKWEGRIRQCYKHVATQIKADPNDGTAWKKYIFLQRALLGPIDKDIVNWDINDRCKIILNDEWDKFTLEVFKKRRSPVAPEDIDVNADHDRLKTQHQKRKLRRSKTLLEAGEISRSYKALQSEFCLPRAPGNLRESYEQKLGTKIYQDLDHNIHADEDKEIILQPEATAKVIKSTKKHVTNCPITSNRYEVFKMIIGKCRTNEELTCLEDLNYVLSMIANGKVPREVIPILTSSFGVVIPKRDNKDRPLGLREGLANLAIKCAVTSVRDTLHPLFSKINFALAGPNKMSELIAMSTNHLRVNPDHDNIFIDVSNAFNECHRVVAQDQISRHCPQLLNLFNLFYGRNSYIFMLDDQNQFTNPLLAMNGCVQGCCMGPLVFGFATLPLYEKLAQDLENKENSFFGAYSDDSLIGAKHEDAVASFTWLQENIAQFDLRLNLGPNKTTVLVGKCESEEEVQRRVNTYRDVLHVDPANIKLHPDNGGSVESYGYIHLGIPVGTDSFCRGELTRLVNQYIQETQCDNEVDSLHQKWVYLLRIIKQKFPFWLKHISPSITIQELPRLNALLKEKMNDIVNVELSDMQWRQTCLPIKSGGCGLGFIDDTVTSAYVAHVDETINVMKSTFTNAPYLDFFDLQTPIPEGFRFPSENAERAVQEYRNRKSRIVDAAITLNEDIAQDDLFNNADNNRKKLQHHYFTYLSRKEIKDYESDDVQLGTSHDRARTLSTDGSFAGAWLHSVPKHYEKQFSNDEFRKAMWLRLGIPFTARPHHCSCRTQSVIDEHVDHILTCKQFNGSIKSRHDLVVREIKSLCHHAGLQWTDCYIGQLRTVSHVNGDTPDGYILGLSGRPFFIDVTIAHPTGATHMRNGSTRHKHFALNSLEANKIAKFERRCHEFDSDFVPLALETYGGTSEKFDKLLEKLSSKAAEFNNIPYPILLNYWKKRISTVLQIGNVSVISEAYRRLFNFGAETLQRDYDLERTFN